MTENTSLTNPSVTQSSIFEQRFWKYVDTESCECHLWTGGKDWDGYGLFNAPKSIRAHIFIYKTLRGPIPEGYVVGHLCNVPCCVNIDHLVAQTQAENVAHRVACGRSRGGKQLGSGDFGWSSYNGRRKPYNTPAVRFWSNIDRNGPVPSHVPHLGNCWLWTAGKSHFGHGTFRYKGKMVVTHRVMWLEECGEIPDGLHVLHRCDIPNCVRPEHLELGTEADNVRHREERGRGNQQNGEQCGKTKYSDELVHKARALYKPRIFGYRAVGETLGIPSGSVPYLIHGRIA